MKEKKRGKISDLIATMILTIFMAGMVLASFTPSIAADVDTVQGLVDKARVTLDEFMRDSNYVWLHDSLPRVKGVLIFPQVLKGGFIFGGSGGTGLLVVRDEKTGDWSQPAFYTIGSISFGLQIGGESAEIIVTAMTHKAIDSLLSSSIKLGGDVSIALGPIGGGAKANVTADFISYAKSKGLYGGLNLEGSWLEVRDSLNKAYYGKDVRPIDIIVKKETSNKGSEGLRETLKRVAK